METTYLDYAATTPLDPRVLDAMLPYFTRKFGNPSSIHRRGQEAETALERSRAEMAAVLACEPGEIIFTSGGSESDNLALRGVAFAEQARRGARRILTTPVEHDAVLQTARDLAQRHGFDLELLPVDEHGAVSPAEVESRLGNDVALVSVIYANNELGTINPLPEIGAVCRGAGVPLHTDAVQAAGQLPLDVGALNVDLMSIGAHKFYGPKGVGALFLREGLHLAPAQTGGGQEDGRRAGTQNVPYIVGMARALSITAEERDEHNRRYAALRDRIIAAVKDRILEARLTGDPENRLPNHASFVFRGLDGNQLLAALDVAGFACSSGSACKTGLPEPSEALTAIGLEPEWALGSLRVTVGRPTTTEDVERLLGALPSLVERLRGAEVVAR